VQISSVISCIAIGEGSPAEPLLHVVIIWRRDSSHIKYEWLPHTWNSARSHEWNETRNRLESTIQRLLHASGALSCEAVIKVMFIIFIHIVSELISVSQFCVFIQIIPN
jgi:DnaJ family protein C protein 16